MTQTEDNTQCCPICVADITDTKALQQDRFALGITKNDGSTIHIGNFPPYILVKYSPRFLANCDTETKDQM